MNSCGKKRSLRLVGALPLLEHGALDAAHRLLLGDAGVGHAVQVAVEQLPPRRAA